MKRLDDIKLHIGEREQKLLKIAENALKKPVKYFKILKKSLDARDKNNIFYVYSIAFSECAPPPAPPPEKLSSPPSVAVIGSGPAGLFCALRLIDHGFRPVIIERGERVEERESALSEFFSGGELDENSNVQFGEGGAGTYSDGKLNTQTRDGLNAEVLAAFVKFGAPPETQYLNKPHVGSDNLKTVLRNIRRYIEERGGKYLFNTAFVSFTQKDGRLDSLILRNVRTGEETDFKTQYAVLAPGHSARDTFAALERAGVAMTAREFAIGLRIEHLNSAVSYAQYGKSYRLLPAADYKLVSHAHSRTVFTFCMCPGGVVIPAASERGGVVTNGMSNYARNGDNSNSALMVQMKSCDFGADDLFAGMRFQQSVERRAYAASRSYRAPVQLLGDFLKDRVSSGFGEVKPTYCAGTVFAPLGEILPPIAAEAIKCALPDMDRRLKGFASPQAVLSGVETRFTSPVRVLRDERGESVSVKGLYPCGEGSGYSGGITSSAADGLKIAENIYSECKNH